ncbi:hypothetical protein CALVIDRAFT_525970 [Calocera viscosa TUFC12733]|uniref:ABM domain-containing protein n=1 Tax=Calocera viscosa (strain TUFC12733) TaxID=1330018 RepID=A0A167P7Y1_CALVF|nr:hypothetical protein CALVIDRAFT_525970 [Calocera viscosa TUFC12733]
MSDTFDKFTGDINIVVHQTAVPGKADELVSLLKAVQASCHSDAEPGCLYYEVLRFDDQICVVERYKDGAAIHTHMNTPAFKYLSSKRSEVVIEGSRVLKFFETT